MNQLFDGVSVRPGGHDTEALADRRHADLESLERAAALRSSLKLRTLLDPLTIEELLRQEIEASDEILEHAVNASEGKWQSHAFELEVHDLEVERFLEWRRQAIAVPELNFHAHPEHYVHTFLDKKRAETEPGPYLVIEQSGPVLLRAFTRFQDWPLGAPEPWPGASRLASPDFPKRRFGELRLKSGTVLGWAFQQYRPRKQGFTFRFTSSMPARLPESITSAHMDHAYVEFTRYLTQIANPALRALVPTFHG